MSLTTTSFDVGITTLTNVSAISRLAYDVRDINKLLLGENPDFLNARRIYDDGKNSPQYDQLGNEMEKFLSLKSLGPSGDGSAGIFDADSTFKFHILGLMNVDESIEEGISTHASYADTYITEKLNDESSGNLAAQASVILTIEMYAIHQLWDGLLDCVEIYNGFNPNADYTGSINPRQSFDNFIALYIGAGQSAGPEFNGDMLYDLAHASGKLFGTLNENGEALVNDNIRNMYQSIQRLMSESDYCTQEYALKELWTLINRIVAQMYVPLMQMLISTMKEEDQSMKVRMYALAIIPQLSQCRPSIQRKLKSYLLDEAYDRNNFSRILTLLQQSYDCLGMSCEDVGAYRGSVVAECSGYGSNYPMAGFIPKENVRTVSKVDLDVFAIRELLRFPSTTNHKIAQLYYRFGRAAVIDIDPYKYDTLSLQEMARSTHRQNYSPYYNTSLEYHKDKFFADSQITIAFERNDISDEQRSAYITSYIQYSVIVEYMMAILGVAEGRCGDHGLDIDARSLQGLKSPSFFWDAFAALYIGSLEGEDIGGSKDTIDGVMMWNLANKRAVTFNTLNDDLYATINDEMSDLLFAGQSELSRTDCVNLAKSTSRVLHLMLIPLIQNTIWFAIQGEGLEANSTSEILIIGEVLASSILPIVSAYDSNAASVIERNMMHSENTKPVSDGAQAVADAFYKILHEIGWGCKYIGEAEGINACQLNSITRVNVNSGMVAKTNILGGLFFYFVSSWVNM